MISPNLIAIHEQPDLDVSATLSPYELDIYNNISNEGRRKEFLIGRYAIKKNLTDNLPVFEGAYNSITVEYGTLRFPIIKDNLIEVGLSHSKQYVFSIIYTKDNVVGVDIETIRSDIPIEEMLSDNERSMIASLPNRARFAYMFFSCKEALGKALRMGLLADYSIYEIRSVESETMHGHEVYRMQFKRFPFLIGYCFMKNEQEICSLVVPQKVDVKEALRLLIQS
ncbi:4'-phosphopantetheinyl transferase superfamily protein [Paenibacillus sp. PR3]|uniref:4'-phosphopantetheinyl transferase superfamily protein n=1 Tax=Paenibacillus terricola TaxID=2763503 RepID=A0ABR8N113_9BACL|nr:4'-phosphopantetheinyl transferase superfamily protein [Paenibacillus terricola]MBD3920880.1 4'-phosphopantetheinyl transferase superfamily protein [Paenibacillus terricola]